MTEKPLSVIVREAIRAEIAPLLAGSVGVQQRVYSLADAALYIGMSEEGLRNQVNLRKVPVVRIDGRLRFDKRDLDSWIEDNTRYEDK